MKKVVLGAAIFMLPVLSVTAFAQEERPEVIEEKERPEQKERKETQEIVIRKKGDKDTKITVEIKGDKVLINGKPLSEFKDGEITINKRNIRLFDGQHNFSFGPVEEMEMLLNGDHMGSFGMNDGKPRAFLGVTTGVENDDNVNDTKPNGAAITNVSKGSAAEKAGLKQGDVITKINDAKVESPGDLTEAIGKHKPKDEVLIQYIRDGKGIVTKAILGEIKENRSMAYTFSRPNELSRSYNIPRARVTPRVQAMPNFEWDQKGNFDRLKELSVMGFPRQQKLGLKIQDIEDGDGVKVLDTDKDSPAEKAGLKKDDVVTEIGGVKIKNTDDARKELMENLDKSTYNIKALRNGTVMSFDIKIPKKLKTANL